MTMGWTYTIWVVPGSPDVPCQDPLFQFATVGPFSRVDIRWGFGHFSNKRGITREYFRDVQSHTIELESCPSQIRIAGIQT
jgi:hypothetical protein